ncbi:MAG: hypothetical protein IJ371_01285 [Clostridia bacterium]|nr:hypothetical protein [Clostridia bacterium]
MAIKQIDYTTKNGGELSSTEIVKLNFLHTISIAEHATQAPLIIANVKDITLFKKDDENDDYRTLIIETEANNFLLTGEYAINDMIEISKILTKDELKTICFEFKYITTKNGHQCLTVGIVDDE